MSEPSRTALTSYHESVGARLVDFAGWQMPIQYESIMQEHQATRTAVGLFDISHMGRIDFQGPDAASFLETVVTRRVCELSPGLVRYSLICNEEGGILDDVLIYRYDDGDEVPVQLVVNASNRDKILRWLEDHKTNEDVTWTDQTLQTCMIAVQGPRAIEQVSPLLDQLDPGRLKYYTAMPTNVMGQSGLISRTGYTGEDGMEITVANSLGPDVWNVLVESAAKVNGGPSGLGARDTLRLEAAMPLYGHELTESLTPFDVGLGFAVQFARHEFIGKAKLKDAKDRPSRHRIGLRILGKRPAREHYPVLNDELTIGEVTSGTLSPTLQYPIAMASVEGPCPENGARVAVDVRGSQIEAVVTELPFYRRPTT